MFARVASKIGPFSVAVFLLASFSLIYSVPVHAQVTGARLSGTVRDASGAVVPNALVSIKDAATGNSRDVTANQDGFYSAPNLAPAVYDATASAPGFASEVEKGVTLTVGGQQVLDFTIKVGEVTQSVEVTGEAPLVDLVSSALSAEVNSTTVRELPLNGRDWTSLATLQPGVVPLQTQMDAGTSGTARGNRGYAQGISVSGAFPQFNNYRIDGISVNDYSNAGWGNVMGGNAGVDAIQEFSLISSNYSAEYGRTAGGVINAITRSGTNQYHGSVYEFLRNNAFDARNFFDPPKIPSFQRNQFGASSGTRILKDKFFVFGDYEGIRQAKGVATLDTVPSLAARGGLLCSKPDTTPACTPTLVTGGTITVPGQVDPSAAKYLPFWYPPNGGLVPGTNGDIGIYNFVGHQAVSENFYTIRGDYKKSDKDSFVVTFLRDVASASAPDATNTNQIANQSNRLLGTVEWTRIFSPTWVNTARIGFSRDLVISQGPTAALNPLALDHSLETFPGRYADQVNIPGITIFNGGFGAIGTQHLFWNSFQFYDDAFWTHGTHSFKFGWASEFMQKNTFGAPYLSGTFVFSSLLNFLNNTPASGGGSVTDPSTTRDNRQRLYGAYIQDDWRLRPNLTLNLGLRWEMWTVPHEVHYREVLLVDVTDQLQCVDPRSIQFIPGHLAQLCDPLIKNPTIRDFDPRVGFAWDPFHNGKTSVRGGYGIFSVPMTISLLGFSGTTSAVFQNNISGTLSNTSVPVTIQPGEFYTGILPILAAGNATSSKSASYIEHDPHRVYVQQYNLTVQHQLPGGVTATVGYVGSHGVHLPFVGSGLQVLPTLTSAGWLYPAPIGGTADKFATQYPNTPFTSIGMKTFNNTSSYNALLLEVQKQLRHGVQFQGSYTWGKSLDSNSGYTASDEYSNSLAGLPSFDLKQLRARSDFDIGRTLVINVTWQIPDHKSFSGLGAFAAPATWITNGWQLGAIYKANDGVPWSPTIGTGANVLGAAGEGGYDFPSYSGAPGCNQSLVNPQNPNNYIKTQCFMLPSAPNMAYWTANCDQTSNIYFNPATGKNGPEPYPVCLNLQGNAVRNVLTGPGISNLDFSIFKNNHIRRISEGFNLQFRTEIFNILNRPNFAFPIILGNPSNTDLYNGNGTPTGVAGIIRSTTTTSREIQFALKASW
jgi:outer membrane receptor protein involved in Fe transport